MPNYNAKPHLQEYRFKISGKEPLASVPVTVRLPKDLDAIVRSQPNRSAWITEAILEKAIKQLEENN